MQTNLIHTSWEKGISYADYMRGFEQAVAEGKTSGAQQTPDFVEYTKLNLHRSQRIEKTQSLTEEMRDFLTNMPQRLCFLVLSEYWCGDAAQNLPMLAMLERESGGKIEMRIVFRDEHPELMDAYLTNGGKSIPKVIVWDAETGEELGSWGPRPAAMQPLLLEYKQNADKPGAKDEFIKNVQLWYAKDKGLAFQDDWMRWMGELV